MGQWLPHRMHSRWLLVEIMAVGQRDEARAIASSIADNCSGVARPEL